MCTPSQPDPLTAVDHRRVERNEDWSLFCPNEAPGLAEVWGDEFDELYVRYEQEGRARKVVRAQQLWFAVCEAQIETGNPYMLFKVRWSTEWVVLLVAKRHYGSSTALNVLAEFFA